MSGLGLRELRNHVSAHCNEIISPMNVQRRVRTPQSAPSHLTYLIDRVDISVAQMVPDPEPQKPGQRFVVE